MAQQDHRALHCGTGTCTRASPLRAEQRVFIVLLIRIVGLIIGHRHWNGGGQLSTPLPAGSRPAAWAAVHRPHLILRPFIYEQTHTDKNCRRDRQTEKRQDRTDTCSSNTSHYGTQQSGWKQPGYRLTQDGAMWQLGILTHEPCMWCFLHCLWTSETNLWSKWISKLYTYYLEEYILCTNHLSQAALILTGTVQLTVQLH